MHIIPLFSTHLFCSAALRRIVWSIILLVLLFGSRMEAKTHCVILNAFLLVKFCEWWAVDNFRLSSHLGFFFCFVLAWFVSLHVCQFQTVSCPKKPFIFSHGVLSSYTTGILTDIPSFKNVLGYEQKQYHLE